MPFLVLAETHDNPRGRFLAETFESATSELARSFPLGTTVTERLRKGEIVATDSYRLRVIPLEASASKRQQTLFD